MAESEKTIFISHSTQDKAAVDAVCDAFDRAGLKYWISTRDIPDGANWSESIISGLNSSQALVLIYSASANQSNYVKRELERAVSKGMPIIPFRIEKVPLSLEMELLISLLREASLLHLALMERIQFHLASCQQDLESPSLLTLVERILDLLLFIQMH